MHQQTFRLRLWLASARLTRANALGSFPISSAHSKIIFLNAAEYLLSSASVHRSRATRTAIASATCVDPPRSPNLNRGSSAAASQLVSIHASMSSDPGFLTANPAFLGSFAGGGRGGPHPSRAHLPGLTTHFVPAIGSPSAEHHRAVST